MKYPTLTPLTTNLTPLHTAFNKWIKDTPTEQAALEFTMFLFLHPDLNPWLNTLITHLDHANISLEDPETLDKLGIIVHHLIGQTYPQLTDGQSHMPYQPTLSLRRATGRWFLNQLLAHRQGNLFLVRDDLSTFFDTSNKKEWLYLNPLSQAIIQQDLLTTSLHTLDRKLTPSHLTSSFYQALLEAVQLIDNDPACLYHLTNGRRPTDLLLNPQKYTSRYVRAGYRLTHQLALYARHEKLDHLAATLDHSLSLTTLARLGYDHLMAYNGKRL